MDKLKKSDKMSFIYAVIGVFILIIAIVGSTYAYYQASATANLSGSAGGGAPTLTVTKLSTSATGNLIPIDMTTDMLTKAAKGWTGSAVGTSWNANYACKDKNGNSVCQIYSVTLKNNSSNAQNYDIGVTSLSGTKTPNIEVVKMASNISVTSIMSIKYSNDGIANDVSVAANSNSSTYYIMVFIKNLNSAQTDSGSFSGVVTATSTAGAEVKATFGLSPGEKDPGCCFDAGSQVLMANGVTKNIEDVRVGDYVMSYDEKTGRFSSQMVTNTITRHNSDDLVYLNLSNGVRIGMRAYHPMLTINGWKSLRPELAETVSDVGHIQKLELSDTLIGYGNDVIINSIEQREPIENYDTYNLTVNNFHNYIVNGVVVHNAECPD